MSNTSANESEYVLGTDDGELARLSRQHVFWLADAAAHWARAGITNGQALLDLGCGPGFATRDLARLVGPEGRVFAIDASPNYIEYVRRVPQIPGSAPIEAKVGDAQQLEFADGSLDAVYARWVFTFIPDPDAVIASVVRALRPGGTFAVVDYVNWPALVWGPHEQTLPVVRRAVVAAYRERGGDDSVGRRLPAMLARHGLTDLELRPLTRIARPDSALWWWPETYFENFLPRVVTAGHMSADELEAWRAEWAANAAEPAGFYMTSPQIEIVARKPRG